MDPFVSQLADLAATHPTRSKWVFVPTHAVGRTLGERIAREGTAVLSVQNCADSPPGWGARGR